MDYAAGKVSDDEEELMNPIRPLPSRQYRDAAEIAIVLGEVKQRRGVRSSEEVTKTEAPSSQR